jgi:hypothetical protein
VLHDPANAAAPAVIGRARERVVLDRFLGAVEELPAALVLEVPAGIGKTTVWREGVAMAGAAGFRVLACSPAESEQQLAYSALSDLLAHVALDADDLPAPQRRALEVALLVEDVTRGAAGRKEDPARARPHALPFLRPGHRRLASRADSGGRAGSGSDVGACARSARG